VNYPTLKNGAFSPRDEDFPLLPGNLLYTLSEKGMYSIGIFSTGSKGRSTDIYTITGCSSSEGLWSILIPSLQLSSFSKYLACP